MSEENQLIICILLWIVTSGVIVIKNWSEKAVSSGLSATYVAIFTVLHFIGALIFIFPWYWYGDFRSTFYGFRVSTYGIIAFGIGNLVIAPRLIRVLPFSRSNNSLNNSDRKIARHSYDQGNIYFFLGLFSYFVLNSLFARVPTLSALASVGQQLMVVGVCLVLYISLLNKDNLSLSSWLLISLTFPFITIINQGFLGYGATMTLTCLLFFARFYRPRWRLITVGIVVVFLGLTFYQSYKRDRPELRRVIWGDAPMSERIEVLNDSLMNTEWFDPFDRVQLDRIEDRLNQNFLVGLAVKRLERHGNYAYGSTIWESILSLVPRIIWKEKSVFAGSGNLVSQYTGVNFPVGTSVGIGQVLEFYINFGMLGVIVGFLGFGTIIRVFDFMSGLYLINKDWQKFMLWFLPGVSFLNVGGSLVEVTGSLGASIFVGLLINLLPQRINRPIIYGISFLSLVFIAKILILPALRPILPYLLIISIVLFPIIFALRYLVPGFKRKVGI
jgi:hypothetical protein